MLKRGQKLSVDPVSLPPGKTWNIGSAETLSSTQGERRIMLQTRLYQCTVDAIQAFDRATAVGGGQRRLQFGVDEAENGA